MDTSRMDRLEEAVKKLQKGSERHEGIMEELKQLITMVVQKTTVASIPLAESSGNTRGILPPYSTLGSAAVQTLYTRLDFPHFAGENPKGPIMWDFKALTMDFTIVGKRTILRGNPTGGITTVEAKQMNLVLKSKPSQVVEAQLNYLQIEESRNIPCGTHMGLDEGESSKQLQDITHALKADPHGQGSYTMEQRLLLHKGRLVISVGDSTIIQRLIAEAQENPLGGHSGVHGTVKRLKGSFHWQGIQQMVRKFVNECDVCQRNKPNLAAYPGLLQPLPILDRIWTDISMDFTEGLPTLQEFDIIYVVVDQLSKHAHFMPIKHPSTTVDIAHVFFDNIFRLHGMPSSIVCDCDPSSDGEEFVVDEFVAIQSITIKNIVEDNCASNTIPVPNIDGKTLAMLIEYCKKHADETITAEDLKQFDSEFVERDQAILFDLLLAANYLNIQSLLDELCKKVADMIKGKSPEEIRKTFNIKNDFTPEEEEEIRKENAWAFEL
ncbi:hypothetical protein F0562_031946 [Nyssa sinensis]|uniref:SKP1-like protein n=1 Tax=Nyssa sinensis TaxID=561372 RepID=A0A5J5AVD4_9ASTE|nr:hypothetical protein F0562_031946 [Nyssa sinensis]